MDPNSPSPDDPYKPSPGEGQAVSADAVAPLDSKEAPAAGDADRDTPVAEAIASEGEGFKQDVLAPPPPPSAAPPAAPARRLPPSQRWRRKGRGQAVGASVGGHVALAGLILGLLVVAGGPKGQDTPPPLPPGATPTPPPLPVVWLDPNAAPTPEPPAPPGDFPVPTSAIPSTLPSVDPMPSEAPSEAPTPAPSEAPMATPRPERTPRPQPSYRPLPPVATLTPYRPPSPRPRPSPRLTAEQRQFQVMRKYRYFEEMTDEELRRQPLPPGVSNWEELPKVVGRLDGLNWLFLPRETANRQDGFSSGTGLVAAGPDGMASGVGVAVDLPATMVAIEPGKPYEELSPDGQHLLVVREGTLFLFATWKTGETEMQVRYRPEGSKPEDPERQFKVPVAPTQAGREQAIREGFVAAAFEDAANETPATRTP